MTVMNNPAVLHLNMTIRRDKCGGCKEIEHARCVLSMCPRFVSIWFLQTGGKGSITCLCTRMCVCVFFRQCLVCLKEVKDSVYSAGGAVLF